TGREIATAATEQVAIKVAIINNGTLGMVKQQQAIQYNERYTQVDLATHSRRVPDFVLLAEALGCVAPRCEREEDIQGVIAQPRATDARPVIIDLTASQEVLLWPMIAAGTGNDHIMAARGIRPLFGDQESGSP